MTEQSQLINHHPSGDSLIIDCIIQTGGGNQKRVMINRQFFAGDLFTFEVDVMIDATQGVFL